MMFEALITYATLRFPAAECKKHYPLPMLPWPGGLRAARLNNLLHLPIALKYLENIDLPSKNSENQLNINSKNPKKSNEYLHLSVVDTLPPPGFELKTVLNSKSHTLTLLAVSLDSGVTVGLL